MGRVRGGPERPIVNAPLNQVQTLASSAEQAFLTASAKNPDAYISLAAGNVLIPVGPKIAATDLPFFALSSPTEAIKT